jgi:hypothetical protein
MTDADPGEATRTIELACFLGNPLESAGAPVSPSVFKTVDGA